jgi:hypothetical protein
MIVYQIVNNCIVNDEVFGTKEAAAMHLFDIVTKAKSGSMLNDLLRIEELEVK